MNEQDYENFKTMLFDFYVAATHQQMEETPGDIIPAIVEAFIVKWFTENYPFKFQIGSND